MRTSNPILNEKSLAGGHALGADAMTVNGTIQKTAGLLFLVICSAAYTWTVARLDGGNAAMPWAIGGAVGGFALVLIMAFKKEWSPFLAPAYALAEGLFLGAISAILEARFRGIVFSAAALTIATLGVLLFAYRLGWVRATDKFRAGVIAATGAVCVVYVVGLVLNLFNRQIPYIHESGWIGIGFSLVVVCVAALNLVLDFDLIEKGSAAGAPRHMEWFASVALLVTLIWLYIEFLRLLAKLNGRR